MSAIAIHLRLAQVQDARTIATMSRDLIEVGLGWKYDAPKIARLIGNPEVLSLVACDRLGLAGFAVLQFGDERAHLVLLAVRPRCQREGVARKLIQWLLASSAAAGMAHIGLELSAGNQAAHDFYRAMGFVEVSWVNHYYREHEAALRMRYVLRHDSSELPLWQPPSSNGTGLGR